MPVFDALERALIRPVSRRRWEFAQANELEFQIKKRERLKGTEDRFAVQTVASSLAVAEWLRTLGVDPEYGTVAEIGSGSHGLIWGWQAETRIAIDPLAEMYRQEFSFLQSGDIDVRAASGEALPLQSQSVDLLLSDNVLDHTQDPAAFLQECARVLAPGAVFYLTVDVHHPVWGLGGLSYNQLFAWGLRPQVPAYPHHPFHFTRSAVNRLLRQVGLQVLWESQTSPDCKTKASGLPTQIKKMFFKNECLRLLCQADPHD